MMRAAVAIVLVAAMFGCASTRDAVGDAVYVLNPWGSADVTVRSVAPFGPYLLFDVDGRREQLRLLAADSPVCRQVLQPEARLRYQKSGVFGRLHRADGEFCDALGVLSLQAWRDRQPRRRTGRSIIPRATARFTLTGEAENRLLTRGRFPLASQVHIPAGFDLVAILPANPTCRTLASRGQATMEFRVSGPDPFRLLLGSDACVIEGFAMPADAATR
jgi:hypothetical protein